MSEYFEGLPACYREVFCLCFTTSFSPNEVTGYSTTQRDSTYRSVHYVWYVWNTVEASAVTSSKVFDMLVWKSVSGSSLEPELSQIFRKRNRLRSTPYKYCRFDAFNLPSTSVLRYRGKRLGYLIDGPGLESRYQVKEFGLFQNFLFPSGAHPASSSMGTGIHFRG